MSLRFEGHHSFFPCSCVALVTYRWWKDSPEPRTTFRLLGTMEICARCVGRHRGRSSHSCRPCRVRALSSSEEIYICCTELPGSGQPEADIEATQADVR
jgi:hypothetical protein